MWRKGTLWLFQMKNYRNLSRECMDMVRNRKPYDKNWIYSNGSTKQCHKDQLYKSENR